MIKLKYILFTLTIILSSCTSEDDTKGKNNIPPQSVYICGYEETATHNNIAKYWKNGKEILLTDGTTNAKANAITIVGNDIYIAGYETDKDNRTIAKY